MYLVLSIIQVLAYPCRR